jgi:hypothetical protein
MLASIPSTVIWPKLFATGYQGVELPGSVNDENETLADSACSAVRVTIADRTLLGFGATETPRIVASLLFGLVEESEQALATRTRAVTVTKRRTLGRGKR